MTASPFKFLDSFDRGDRSIFFGRDAEIEELYRLLFEARLVLVYGQSGAGKTSLIRCGLANRFADTDWFELFVRRNDDLNKSLARETLAKATTQIPDDKPPVEAIRSLYLDHLRPVYLIFDQFEELFVLGSADEQKQFFATIAAILASDVSCKIIVSMREEYLGALYPFESVVPALFNKRLRVEQMSMTNIEEVITGMTGALGIKLEHGPDTAQKIIAQLDDGRNGVQLAYLQVYLDSLYQRAAPRGEPVTFTDQDVEETGKLGDLMAGYLQTQKTEIENDLRAKHPDLPRDSIQHLLEAFVTAEGTKQPTTRADVLARMPESAPWLDDALAALENARILRANDQNIELAHDALAKLIADARSADRLAMINIERLVSDALFHHQQDKSAYLSPKDLRTIRRAQKLAATGVATLDLSPDERTFIGKSRFRMWRRRATLTVGTVVLIILILILSGVTLPTDTDAIAATSEVDNALYSEYEALIDSTDLSSDVRKNLLLDEEAINTERDASFLHDDHFWANLKEADLKIDKNVENADNGVITVKPGLVAETYGPLFQQSWDKYKRGEDLLRTRVQLKAVLRRELQWAFYNNPLSPQQRLWKSRLLQLFFTITAPQESDPVKTFKGDIQKVCERLSNDGESDPKCTQHPRSSE